MKIARSRIFKKNFKSRISSNPKLVKKFKKRVQMFLGQREHRLLKDHKLSGKKKNYRAFSVTGDIRVVYTIQGNVAVFMDIGTHNQVY